MSCGTLYDTLWCFVTLMMLYDTCTVAVAAQKHSSENRINKMKVYKHDRFMIEAATVPCCNTLDDVMNDLMIFWGFDHSLTHWLMDLQC